MINNARAGGHAPPAYKNRNAVNRLLAFGSTVGNEDWVDYLKHAAEKNGGEVWPKLRLHPGTTREDIEAYVQTQRTLLFGRTLIIPVSFPTETAGHRNLLAGSLRTTPMQFFEIEPHGTVTHLTKEHERNRTLLQALVHAISRKVSRPAVLIPYTEACVRIGPQAVDSWFMSEHINVEPPGLCTMWSLLFAKKFLEAGNAGAAVVAVREIQEDMGGGPGPTNNLRRQRGLKQLVDMADGVTFAYQRRHPKMRDDEGVARLSRQERQILLPGYVSPAERIAKALRASTKTPLPVYRIRLGSDSTDFDMRKLYVHFCGQAPVVGPTTECIPRYEFPPRFENHTVDLDAFAKIVTTVMAKDLDLLPFESGCPKQLVEAADFASLVTATKTLMEAWYAHTKTNPGVMHDFRSSDALSAACVFGFNFCCGAGKSMDHLKFDPVLLYTAVRQMRTDLTTAHRRCAALLWFACCYGETPAAAWPRATLLSFAGCAGGAAWKQVISEPERLALVASAKEELDKFMLYRQYTTDWRYKAGLAGGMTAGFLIGLVLPPAGLAVSAAAGAAIGLRENATRYYYRLTGGDVEWLIKLQRRLAASLVDLMFVVDAGTVVNQLQPGMRLKEVMLKDNVETTSVWRRRFQSQMKMNQQFH